jgi:hypothetical protein
MPRTYPATVPCGRFRCPRGAGSRTQHTSSALPISSAATLAMISSRSSHSANTAAPPLHTVLLDGDEVIARGAAQTPNLIGVLDQTPTAATMQGPHRTPAPGYDTAVRCWGASRS